jgi:dipeptidyl aminopeptidase/acylaminoacyl peptidase
VNRFVCFISVFLLCVVLYPCRESSAAQESKRPVTVADLIRMTKLGHPKYWVGSSKDVVAQFSQDGKKFVTILRKGNLEDNTNEFSMLGWLTAEAFQSPRPDVLLSMSSSSNRPAIEEIKWLPDGETVSFLGERRGEPHQLFVFNIRKHTLKKLTNHPTNIVAYSTSWLRDRIAYLAQAPDEGLFDEKARREGLVVTSQHPAALVAGRKKAGFGANFEEETQLFFKIGTHAAKAVSVPGVIAGDKIEMSPDGMHLIIATYVDEIPERWKAYSIPFIDEMAVKMFEGQHSWLQHYLLVDTNTATIRPLLDSPISTTGSDLVWAPDSRSVVATNVYLPLGSTTAGDQCKVKAASTVAVEVDIGSGETSVISEQDATNVLKLSSWDGSTKTLVFEKRDRFTEHSGPKLSFRKSGVRWEAVEARPDKQPRPEIILLEDVDTPPKIYAHDPKTHRKELLLDLNPQFRDLEFARVEEVSWTGTHGLPAKGGLYYPIGYLPGRRYPLVIQTHGWSSERFLPDGPWTTAYAAQPLAGHGIMVLQVGEFDGDGNYDWWYANLSTPREVDRAVSSYEGAIDYLERRGLIDRDRVGIIGFSRTCLFVTYALTHSRYTFLAASITDGVDGGYLQYLLSITSNPAYALEMEKINGGTPFGEKLGEWEKNSPSFSLTNVRTALRITAPSLDTALDEWEWFAGLTRLGMPVEMVMMQDGDHILQRPWERVVSQQGNVDWFSFWLNGEVDRSPAKAGQYARWGKMRARIGRQQ